MLDKIYSQLNEKMDKTINALKEEYATFRTGRANANLLNKVKVDYYGVSSPLNQVATVSVPDPKQIVVTPFDKSAVNDIAKAIQKSDIGITPLVDGAVIRLNVPQLTGERRQELVKILKKKSEDYKVAIRNHRRDSLEVVKKAKNDEHISEDDVKKANDKIQKITDQSISKVDELSEAKAKDILSA
ncbi:MAG: ribosome recycling factor [Candidatus Wallbacteria bacterium]